MTPATKDPSPEDNDNLKRTHKASGLSGKDVNKEFLKLFAFILARTPAAKVEWLKVGVGGACTNKGENNRTIV